MKKISKVIIIIAVIIVGLVLGVFIYNKANIQDFVDRKKTEYDEKEVVATVSGQTLSKKECIAYLASMKDRIEGTYNDDETIWDYVLDKEGTTYGEVAKESLLEKIVYIKLVCANAPQYNVSLTSEDKVDINGKVQKFFASISDETAEKYGLTTELLTKIYSENMLANKVYNKITLNFDPSITEEECIKGRFKMISFDKCHEDENGNLVYYTEKEQNDIEDRAKECYALVNAGAFVTAQEKYNPGVEEEIVLGMDDLPKDIANTVMSMQANSSSRLLESVDAFYIFYCVEPHDEAATQKAYQEKISELRDEHFKDLYTIWYGDANIEINRELWDSIPLKGDK